MANEFTGQPGNAVPMLTPNSTNEVRLGYMFWARQPLSCLSSATSVSLGTSQAGIQVLGGASSGVIVNLPVPEPGLVFDFVFDAAPASAATIIRTGSSSRDILIGGGAGTSTNTAVQLGSTDTEIGQYVRFIGLSTSRWFFAQLQRPVSSAYTSDAAAGTLSLWAAVDSTA